MPNVLIAQGDRPRFGLDLLDDYMESNDPKMQLFKVFEFKELVLSFFFFFLGRAEATAGRSR